MIISNEIGSEFWNVPVKDTANSIFPQNVRWFISGTAALQFVLRDILLTHVIKTAALPSWCCGCMIEPFIKSGIQVFYYSVYMDSDGWLVNDYLAAPVCDITLDISYFGYARQRRISAPKGIVISDLTHSLFSEPREEGTYCFGSLRKWAGFWTGGFAWKSGSWNLSAYVSAPNSAYVGLRRCAMEDKRRYLMGEGDKSYLKLFEKAENYLDHCEVMGGSERDIDFAQRLDVSDMKKKRRNNAEHLLCDLQKNAIFPELKEGDCPLFVPILLQDTETRDSLRRYLIDRQIYCPIHWEQSARLSLNARERYLYQHELSIVCDQRYDDADMDRMLAALKAFAQ